MLFSSLEFIFRFLPVFLIIYYIVPAKFKNFVLVAGSLYFYAVGEPVYVLLMILCMVVNYFAALAIEGCGEHKGVKTLVLVFDILYNVGVLLFFKYAAFIVDIIGKLTGEEIEIFEVALPLGISFYTFQILSYIIDVYRGVISAENDFIRLGAYLSMFPQLIAGPIVVYKDVRDRLLNPESRITLEGVEKGLATFTIGLGSKVIFANRLGQLWESVQTAGYDSVSMTGAWIGLLAYTFQIYFDFCGYSLMAVGLGQLLGFEFPKNFNHPYIAGSVTDFWKRWHISLTSFFREYIYIPMGGNRKGIVRTLFNMFIVWAITGFWHGASYNFVLWGVYYFVFLALERVLHEPLKKLDRNKYIVILRKILGHMYTLLVVCVGWVIFAITDLTNVQGFLRQLFVPQPGGVALAGFEAFMFGWLLAAAVFATPLPGMLYEKIKKTPLQAVVLFVIFWVSISQLVDSVYNPFLYFRF